MLERRTFIVRFHAHDDRPVIEDVCTGERARLPDLASIADELRRRLTEPTGDPPAAAAPGHDEQP